MCGCIYGRQALLQESHKNSNQIWKGLTDWSAFGQKFLVVGNKEKYIRMLRSKVYYLYSLISLQGNHFQVWDCVCVHHYSHHSHPCTPTHSHHALTQTLTLTHRRAPRVCLQTTTVTSKQSVGKRYWHKRNDRRSSRSIQPLSRVMWV